MAGEEPSPADVAEIFKAFAGADGKMTADGLADVMINQCDTYLWICPEPLLFSRSTELAAPSILAGFHHLCACKPRVQHGVPQSWYEREDYRFPGERQSYLRGGRPERLHGRR